jgi:hypothetical protein
MSRRWWKTGKLKPGDVVIEKGSRLVYDKRLKLKLVANGIGAVMTAVVMIVFAVTKFTDGAWFVIILIPLLVLVFSTIHRHYTNVAADLRP